MNKEELEKLLEEIKKALLEPLDQIEAKRKPRRIRRPPPISPEILEHNAAGIMRTFRRKREKGEEPLGRASFRIEPDLLKAAKAAAKARRISFSELICELIKKELDK